MNIASKILTPSIVSVGIFLIALELVFMPYYEDKQLDAIIKSERAELQVLVPIIAEELAAGDLAKIYSILQHQAQIHAEESDGGIVLYSNTGDQLYPLGERPLFHIDDERYLIITEELKWGNEHLGNLRYELEIDHELEHVTEQLSIMRGGAAFIILCIVIFGSWWSRKLVIIPLRELQEAAKSVQKGNFETHLISRSKDEIGDVYNAFNKMQNNISAKNQALSEAVIRAEQATRAKSDFLANMSHEIRTPMNAIIGLAYLTQETSLTSEQHNNLTKIEQSSKNLLRIINDILDFSKIEAGQLIVEKISFSLDELLQQVHTLNHHKADSKGIRLAVRRDLTIPDQYKGDPLRISQVLTNLVGNAVKFTSSGEVTVTAELTGKDSCRLQFTVIDSGIGISEEQIRNLFTPFTQADSSTTRKYGGTGLGLSISKNLVELMGGTISVESTPGRGSHFSFTLPVSNNSRNGGTRYPALGDINLLLLGENPDLEQVLHSFGISAVKTLPAQEPVSLKEIMQAYNGQSPDLVFISDPTGHVCMEKLVNTSDYTLPTVLLDTEEKGTADSSNNVFRVSELTTPSAIYNAIVHVLNTENELNLNYDEISEQLIENKLHGKRILLAEDNPINTEVARGLLEKHGLQVSCCENGQEVLKLLDKETFDLVLMDVQMPVMDGYEACEYIREDLRFKELPIVALTANAMRGDSDKSLAAGMNDHLSKPIDPELLRRTLSKWLLREETTDEYRLVTDARTGPQVLNTRSGLERASGEWPAYLKLLKMFMREHQRDQEIIQLLSEQEAWDTLAAKAHALKGSSATLGASELSGIAQIVEKEARSETHLPPALLEQIDSAFQNLGQVIEELNATHGNQSVDEKKGPTSVKVHNDSLKKMIKELNQALSEGDIAAIDLADKLREVLHGSDNVYWINQICRSLEEYDFDSALQILLDKPV